MIFLNILSYSFYYHKTESPTQSRGPAHAFQKFLKGMHHCLVGGCLLPDSSEFVLAATIYRLSITLYSTIVSHVPEGMRVPLCPGAASLGSLQEVLVSDLSLVFLIL